VTNEDLMIQAARLILSTDVEGKAEGRSAVKHSPFQLIVHQDECGANVHTDQGDVPLREDEIERLTAQAEVVPGAAPVADPDGKTPARLVKRVLARDNHRCQNCGHTLHLQVHHVEWRVDGGKTEEDLLASLCTRCHSMVHQGLLSLHGNRREGFVFLDRSGAAVDGETAVNDVVATLHTALAAPPGSGDSHMDILLHRYLMVGARRSLVPAGGSNARAFAQVVRPDRTSRRSSGSVSSTQATSATPATTNALA
jgi:HNH endonuclease